MGAIGFKREGHFGVVFVERNRGNAAQGMHSGKKGFQRKLEKHQGMFGGDRLQARIR